MEGADEAACNAAATILAAKINASPKAEMAALDPAMTWRGAGQSCKQTKPESPYPSQTALGPISATLAQPVNPIVVSISLRNSDNACSAPACPASDRP